jgi:hypothetical protein
MDEIAAVSINHLEPTGQPDLIIAGEPHFSRSSLAFALGKSRQTLAGWASRGYGPRFRKLGKTPAYPVAAVRAWLDAMTNKMEG